MRAAVIRLFVAIACAALAVGAAAAQEQATRSPLVFVEDGSVQIIDGRLHCVIRNATEAPVTAWRLAADYTLVDSSSRRIVYEREGYLAFSGIVSLERSQGRIVPPRGRLAVSLSIPSSWSAVSSVAARIETAIFADGTSFGSDPQVANIFSARERDMRPWMRIKTALEAAQATGTVDALAQAVEDLNVPGDPLYSHPMIVVARREMEAIVSGARPSSRGGAQLTREIADWVQRAEARIQAAAHSARRR